MNKLIRNIVIGICIVWFLYFICFYMFDFKTIIIKKTYPKKYEEHVEIYAKEYEVDPLLIYAIIKTESNFNSNAKSHSDARGLMQLMENTAIEISNNIDENLETVNDLYNPETNIKLGTCYFANLLNQYKNVGLALASYNAGMGRVAQWIQEGIIKPDGSDLENIPYQETNMYVRKVLNYYQVYQDLY